MARCSFAVLKWFSIQGETSSDEFVKTSNVKISCSSDALQQVVSCASLVGLNVELTKLDAVSRYCVQLTRVGRDY